MGLFKKRNDYEDASENLNSKPISYAKDRIIMEQIRMDDDEHACSLVDKLKEGSPLVLNFEKLQLMTVNKLLAFFSGACYALDGNVIKINTYTYLFARKVDFLDGTLNNFIENI